MFATLSIIALVALGFIAAPFWVVVPFALLNGYIGLHFPAGKAQTLRERGQFWQVWATSLPIQALLALVIFGIGYAIGYLFR